MEQDVRGSNRWHTWILSTLFVGFVVSLGGLGCKKAEPPATPIDAKPMRPPAPSGTFSLDGRYVHVGMIGLFEDCTTGQRWRVSQEGDHMALEEAYINSGVPLGSPLVVTVEGGIDERPSPDRPGRESMLIVARFVEAFPGADCPTVPR